MNSIISKRQFIILIIFFVLLVPFISFDLISQNNNNDTSLKNTSVELGIASFSPSGEEGGAAIPASCGSPHSGDLCTPPTFKASISINEGDSAPLTWSCIDSSSSSGINFSTGGMVSGSTDVSPITTTTYTLLCSNGGRSTVIITVLHPKISITATPSLLRLNETSVIGWTTSSINSCSVSEDNPDFIDSWSGTLGTQTTSPITGETTYTLKCENIVGSISENVKVKLIPTFKEF